MLNQMGLLTSLTAEKCYVLGFLWADGHFNNATRIECVKEDIDDVLSIFKSVGGWSYYTRERPKRKPQVTLTLLENGVTQDLHSLGYVPRRVQSPDRILSFIPEKLKSFWFLGFFDGDGNWYYNDKYSLSQFTVSGQYSQDWSFVCNLFDLLSLKYSTHKVIHKTGYKASCVRITNKKDVISLGEYLYRGHNLGLSRKRLSYLSYYL